MPLKLSIVTGQAPLGDDVILRMAVGNEVDLHGSHWFPVYRVISDLGEGAAFFRYLPEGHDHVVEGRHAIVSADTGRSRAYAQPDHRRAQV